jgi:hypothetical protein
MAGVTAPLMPSDVPIVLEMLKYHVLPAKITEQDLLNANAVMTMQGEAMVVEKSSAGPVVNRNAQIVASDFLASNGIVHIVNAVLSPPSMNIYNPPATMDGPINMYYPADDYPDDLANSNFNGNPPSGCMMDCPAECIDDDMLNRRRRLLGHDDSMPPLRALCSCMQLCDSGSCTDKESEILRNFLKNGCMETFDSDDDEPASSADYWMMDDQGADHGRVANPAALLHHSSTSRFTHSTNFLSPTNPPEGLLAFKPLHIILTVLILPRF